MQTYERTQTTTSLIDPERSGYNAYSVELKTTIKLAGDGDDPSAIDVHVRGRFSKSPTWQNDDSGHSIRKYSDLVILPFKLSSDESYRGFIYKADHERLTNDFFRWADENSEIVNDSIKDLKDVMTLEALAPDSDADVYNTTGFSYGVAGLNFNGPKVRSENIKDVSTNAKFNGNYSRWRYVISGNEKTNSLERNVETAWKFKDSDAKIGFVVMALDQLELDNRYTAGVVHDAFVVDMENMTVVNYPTNTSERDDSEGRRVVA